MPIDITVPLEIVRTPEDNTATDLPTEVPPANVYAEDNDDFFIADLDMLLLQQTLIIPGTIVYTMNYAGVDEGKVYEAVLHVSADNQPSYTVGGVLTYFTQTIKVEAFGNVIYRDTTDMANYPLNLHFAFVNTANTDSFVRITYTTNLDVTATGYAPPGAYVNFLQFGITEHSQVLTEEGVCESTCDPKVGMPVGANYAFVPPICVYCNAEFNEEFDPLLGTCGCIDGFTSVNGVCIACTMPLCAECTSTG